MRGRGERKGEREKGTCPRGSEALPDTCRRSPAGVACRRSRGRSVSRASPAPARAHAPCHATPAQCVPRVGAGGRARALEPLDRHLDAQLLARPHRHWRRQQHACVAVVGVASALRRVGAGHLDRHLGPEKYRMARAAVRQPQRRGVQLRASGAGLDAARYRPKGCGDHPKGGLFM